MRRREYHCRENEVNIMQYWMSDSSLIVITPVNIIIFFVKIPLSCHQLINFYIDVEIIE